MSFKLHLIIVSVIIVLVYLAGKIFLTVPLPATTPMSTKKSPFSIAITHATWGLNCRYRLTEGMENDDGFVKDIRVDNALKKVSELCNDKPSCTIAINENTLGRDPYPGCFEKELDIEYRCYSFDRPWRVRGNSGTISIDCTKLSNE
jgi:hypothetical protein